MPSTSVRIALLVGLGLAFVPLSSDASLSAAPSPSTTAPSTLPEPTAAPKPLAESKLLKRINGLLGKIGRHRLARPPKNGDMLTMRTPALDNGAKITSAWHVTMWGPTLRAPNGVFRMHDRPNDVSQLRFAWPTEIGKTYVLDCTASAQYPAASSTRRPTAHW